MLTRPSTASSRRIAIVVSAVATGSATGVVRADPFVFADSFENGLAWSKFDEVVEGNVCSVAGIGEVSVVELGELGVGHGLGVYANHGGVKKSNHVIAQNRLLDVGPYGAWVMSTWVYVDPVKIVDTQTGPEFSLQNTRPFGLDGDGVQQWRTLTAGVQYVGSQHDPHQGWRVWGIQGPGPLPDSEEAEWLDLDEPLRLDHDGWYELTLSVDYDALTYDALTIRFGNEITVVPLGDYPLAREVKFHEAGLWATLESENLYACNTHQGEPGYGEQDQVRQNELFYDDVRIEQTDGDVGILPAAEDGWVVSLSGSGAWTPLNAPDDALADLRFGDFNGDGKTDVFRADGSQWWVSWSGAGTWAQLKTSSYTVGSLAFADFNHDKETDVFRADGSKWWVSWSGAGPWTQLNVSGYTLGSLAFADFNDDRESEVFRADGSKWWVSWSGAGPWSQLNTSGYTLGSLAFADFDHDGASDVFRADGSKWWVSWGGTGPWSQLNTSGYTLGSLRFGDFNADRDSEVFRVDGANWWVSSSGTGPWVALASSGHTLEHLALHDFNGDGHTDVFRAP